MNKRYTLQHLSEQFNLELVGDGSVEVSAIAPLENAQAGDLSFLDNSKYQKYLTDTKASVVIVSAEHKEQSTQTNLLVSANPYLDYAKIAHLFSPDTKPAAGIHPSAVVADSARVDATASIGPNVVLEEGVVIGADVIIKANSTIGKNSTVGAGTIIWSNVSIFYGVTIGAHCEIYSGVVIGSDGFGFAQTKAGWHKVPQLGSVILEDHVSIGANTCIDRGSTGNTVIAQGAKLDNLIQVAHNVHIGAHTAIAGCVAIAGSTKIGQFCQVGGGAGIGGHLTIGDFIGIAGMSQISKSLSEPGHYTSHGMGVESVRSWMKFVARLRGFEKLMTRVKSIEEKLKGAL